MNNGQVHPSNIFVINLNALSNNMINTKYKGNTGLVVHIILFKHLLLNFALTDFVVKFHSVKFTSLTFTCTSLDTTLIIYLQRKTGSFDSVSNGGSAFFENKSYDFSIQRYLSLGYYL